MSTSFDKPTVLEFLERLRRKNRKRAKVYRAGSVRYQIDASPADSHRYELNPPLPQSEVAAFEAQCGITLPDDYRYFITEIGNGGAGPFFGLNRFGEDEEGNNWQGGGLVGDIAAPFAHDDAWNLPQEFWDKAPDPEAALSPEDEDRLMEAWDEALNEHYWNPKVMNGAIPICHRGCALRQWLVVTGSQRGYIWNDDRVDDAGISPLRDAAGRRMTFVDWYMSWLNKASGLTER